MTLIDAIINVGKGYYLMIRQCQNEDTERIYFVINQAAGAYEGSIPADCYHQPYMSREELDREMKRITFFGWEADGELVGVMGIEPIKGVTLIRHAYVLPQWQQQGIGSQLLNHLKGLTSTRQLLVGTWADARQAIAFYQKHGFHQLPERDELLTTYWDIPQRQIETSIVMGMDIETESRGRI